MPFPRNIGAKAICIGVGVRIPVVWLVVDPAARQVKDGGAVEGVADLCSAIMGGFARAAAAAGATGAVAVGAFLYSISLTNFSKSILILNNSPVQKIRVTNVLIFFNNKNHTRIFKTNNKKDEKRSPTGVQGAPAKRCGATLAVK